MKFYKISVLIIFALSILACEDKEIYPDNLTDAINNYRSENGLAKVPESISLTIVAEKHVRDLYYNHPDTGLCNSHSWSNNGDWTAGCYTNDLSSAEIMWNKPKELTTYPGYGYEITAFSSSEIIQVKQVLDQWKKSEEHRNIILNRGSWATIKWKAMGTAVFKNYAVVWFGKETDNLNK